MTTILNYSNPHRIPVIRDMLRGLGKKMKWMVQDIEQRVMAWGDPQ